MFVFEQVRSSEPTVKKYFTIFKCAEVLMTKVLMDFWKNVFIECMWSESRFGVQFTLTSFSLSPSEEL